MERAPTAPAVSPFRVVRCYFRLPPEPGGMEAHVAQLSRAQRRLGIDVVNVFNVGKPEGAALQLLPGRDLLHVRPALARNLLFYSAAIARRSRLRNDAATVLHAHGDWSDFVAARYLARAIGARVLAATLHDRIAEGKGRLYRFALRGFDPIFATGKADQVALERLLNRQVYHLPSAPADIFLKQDRAMPTEYDVIGVTNFFAKKAPDLFLDCAARRPGLRFVLYGDGPLREQLERRVVREGISNVVLPGRRPQAEVADALRRSRLFLSTALKEGTPTAALEAMACGLPVVLTPSNDYSWLVDAGHVGYVAANWNIDEIVHRIDQILSDDALRQAMGMAARERALRHSWAANASLVSRLMADQIGRSAWPV